MADDAAILESNIKRPVLMGYFKVSSRSDREAVDDTAFTISQDRLLLLDSLPQSLAQRPKVKPLVLPVAGENKIELLRGYLFLLNIFDP